MGKLLCNNVFINCNKVIKGDAAGRERNLLEKLKAFDWNSDLCGWYPVPDFAIKIQSRLNSLIKISFLQI